MEFFYIPIIIVVALFLLFIILNIIHDKKSKAKSKPKKEEVKQTPTEQKQEKEEKIVPVDIDLSSRPDFSDFIEKDKPSNGASNFDTLKVSDNILNSGNAYRRDYMPRNTELSNEISNLSPELKAIIFGNILNDDR